MSRIGKKTIAIPDGIEVKLQNNRLAVKGPKGTLEMIIHHEVSVKIGEKEVNVEKIGKSKKAPAIWGLTRALIDNMIVGVKDGYVKKLELQGVGFRMAVQGKKINMALGFSHPVVVDIPEGLEAKIEENNVLSIAGPDKQSVGQFAAEIRKLKKVEPYKGKGFRYVGEHVRRKAGKKAAAK
ncbi:MAG: 50S ribosomal protein L6 [Parcubacteria group bacterium]|jgi:large subunit ribosomal protein L6